MYKKTTYAKGPPFSYYAGHGIEHKRKVYLVSRDTKVDDEDDLEGECVPLDMVMQMLVEELDVPVRLKLGAECVVTFAIVLDFCRGSLSNSCCVDVYSEPKKPSPAPYKCIIIFPCSRTMPASDGQSGGNGPFAEAILDSEHRGFAEGIAFQPANPRVSKRLKQFMLIKKDILTHATADAISEHFCIRPAPVPDTYYHGTFGIHAVKMTSRSVSITSRRTSTNMPMIGNEVEAAALESVQTQAQDEVPDLAFKRKLNDIVGEQATKG